MRLGGISSRLQKAVPEFARFACVGTGGFVVDTCLVHALRSSVGLYAAAISAYIGASVITWILNRSWTFKARVTARPTFQQWLSYLGASSGGFVLNRGAFFAAVTYSGFVAEHPVLGVAIGSIAGLMLNFALSRAVVFRSSSI
jgi:putative flippase GtrA